MPGQPVVSNNTPLVALWSLQRLDLLKRLFGEVLVPTAVEAEFLATESAQRAEFLATAPWLRVVPVQRASHTRAFIGLDRGEAAVLLLAEELDARLVLMDEQRGRRYARRLGLPLTGTLGILLLAKEEGLVPTIAPLIDQLMLAGFSLGADLIARTLLLAGELSDPQ